MAETKTYTVTTEECGKTLHITLEDCCLTASSLHIHPCCTCGGSGGSGNGNGGNGGNGNGNGDGNGDGNGNGNGNGNGDGNGGNSEDDDKNPGDLEITLLGSTGADGFCNLLLTGDGYMAQGYSGNNWLVAEFDPTLSLSSQTKYASRVHTGQFGYFSVMTDDEAKPSYLLVSNPLPGVGQGWPYATLLKADRATKEVELCTSTSVQNWQYFQFVKVPENFTGSASYAEFGAFVPANSNRPCVALRDGNANLLVKKYCGFPGQQARYQGGIVVRDKVIAVGWATGNFISGGTYSGFIVVMNDILEQEAIIAYGYDTNITFQQICKSSDGYVIAGSVVNRNTGKRDLLVLGLDEDFKILRRSMIGGQTGDEILTSLDMDGAGNLLLCGTTSSVGAGSTDVFLLRLNPELKVTKELVFGSAAAESTPCARFNPDGSVTFVGATAGAGAGSTDAFIATARGNWSELTGGLKKYPALRINAKPGFSEVTDFNLTFNDKTTWEVKPETALAFTTPACKVNTNPGLIVDPNAVIEV